MHLSGHRAEAAHLPHQPFEHGHALAQARRQEFAGLLAEIEQDRARFEDADRRWPGPSGSTMAGMRLFGLIARNSGCCSPLEMFDRLARVYGSPISSSATLILRPFGVFQVCRVMVMASVVCVMEGRRSGERRGDVLPEARALAEPRATSVRDSRAPGGRQFLDAVPAARVGAEHEIGEREAIAFEMVAALQLRVDDPPQTRDRGFRRQGERCRARMAACARSPRTPGARRAGASRASSRASDRRPRAVSDRRDRAAALPVLQRKIADDRIRFPQHEVAVDERRARGPSGSSRDSRARRCGRTACRRRSARTAGQAPRSTTAPFAR